MAESSPTTLERLANIDVSELRGVGPKARDILEAVGIATVADLLTHYPRRYVDRTRQEAIADLAEGDEAMVLATVRRVAGRQTRQRRSLVEIDLFDGSSYLRVSFFNQPWRARQLREGMQVVVFGKVERYRGRRQMTNPVVDLVGDRTRRIVPVYPQSEKAGLTSWDVGEWIAEALRRVRQFVDPLPERWREQLQLPSRDWAMRQVHQPESLDAAYAARRRLAFDELLRLQVILVMRKRAIESEAIGIRHDASGDLVARFLDALPFPLTQAQKRAVDDITRDLQGPHPMHRLLQGDVGSGKTVVAVAAVLAGVQGGYQGAFMAPTEVLAEQHYASVRDLLAGLEVQDTGGSLFATRPVSVGLLTSRVGAAERARLHAGLADRTVDVLIGTHALLTEAVGFQRLGVVVIDEQHRFGVEQRAALRDKGGSAVPDVLVMTATPIPRTAAMTVYGDLDTTVLDEMPPGRTPITTVWTQGELQESEAWARVLDEAGAGRQAYVVCPLVEDSPRVEARSAAEERDRLAAEQLAGLRLGLLHGQLPAREKEAVMADFRTRRIDALVATTVVEVGVDVPNATVMVIEDADRFGIAQLHQLRGRVGRGSQPSWCYLLGSAAASIPDSDGARRLAALASTTDGFELAEVDLELRGEGTILGARQKGATDLKLASLRRDKELVATARRVAFDLVDSGDGIAGLPDLEAEIRSLVDDDDREFLFKS